MLVASDRKPELAGGVESAWSKTGWFLLVTHPWTIAVEKLAALLKFLSYERLLFSAGYRPSNSE